MAKKTPNTQQMNTAKGGIFGRIFSRNKGAKDAGDMAMAKSLRGQQPDALTSKAPRKGVFTATATGADRAIGRAHGMLSRVNQIAVFGGMAAGALGAMGKLPLVGKFFTGASEVALKPNEFMENTKVKDLGGMASKSLGRARDAVASRKGEASGLAARLGNAQERVSGLEGGFAESAKKYAHRVSEPLGGAVEKHGAGMLGKLSGVAGRGAEKHVGKAHGLLDNVIAQGADNKALSGVTAPLEAAKKALSGDKMDAEAYTKAMEEAKKGLGDLAKGAVDKKTLGTLKKSIDKAGEAGMTAGQRSGMAAKLSGLPGAIKNAPDTLANANLKNVALKGAVVTGTALQVTGTARGIGEKVSTLKGLYTDLTGEQKISTRKLLFSKNVPDVIKEARGHILKEYGPRVVLNFANTIATYTFMKNTSMKSMIGSFGLMAASSLHSAKVQSYGILPMYEAMSKMPQIDDVQYAAFISAASKDAAAAGGVESPLVQALAVDYARSGARPADILKDIETGRFDERAMEKVQQNRAAMGAGDFSAPKATQPGMDRGVVGAHTQRLQNEGRGMPQQQAR